MCKYRITSYTCGCTSQATTTPQEECSSARRTGRCAKGPEHITVRGLGACTYHRAVTHNERRSSSRRAILPARSMSGRLREADMRPVEEPSRTPRRRESSSGRERLQLDVDALVDRGSNMDGSSVAPVYTPAGRFGVMRSSTSAGSSRRAQTIGRSSSVASSGRARLAADAQAYAGGSGGGSGGYAVSYSTRPSAAFPAASYASYSGAGQSRLASDAALLYGSGSSYGAVRSEGGYGSTGAYGSVSHDYYTSRMASGPHKNMAYSRGPGYAQLDEWRYRG